MPSDPPRRPVQPEGPRDRVPEAFIPVERTVVMPDQTGQAKPWSPPTPAPTPDIHSAPTRMWAPPAAQPVPPPAQPAPPPAQPAPPAPSAEGPRPTLPWAAEQGAGAAGPGAPQKVGAGERARSILRAVLAHPIWARIAAAFRALFRRKPRPEQQQIQKTPLKRRILVWTKRLAIAAVALAILGVVAFFLLIRHYEKGLPSTAELRNYNPPQVTRILARDGAVLGEIFTERRTLVPIAEIPPVMKYAALAAEDARFYKHEGLNYLGMLRALLVNLRYGEARQGGSTITQQVVKNVLLTSERTFDRKIRELILTRDIEQELSKDQILELYLNHIYFGHGRYGVEEAARYYFGKSVREVTLGEATLLAGLVKGPSIYSPRRSPERATQRRNYVLGQMRDKKFAPAAEVEAALREPVRVAAEPDLSTELAPEIVAEAERVLKEVVGAEDRYGGYTVTTSIDPKMQAAARAAVRQNLDAYAERHRLVAPLARGKGDPAPFQGAPKDPNRVYHGVVTGADDARGTLAVRVGTVQGAVDLRKETRYNPRHLPPSRFAEVGKVLRVRFLGAPADGKLRLDLAPQTALIAIDVRTREVLAIIGGYEGVRGGFDRASSAKRQPGSTFKAFVYSYGIHTRRFTAASMVETNPAALEGYRPGNYDESEGQTPKRLRDALAHSVNVSAVWALQQLGPQEVVNWARALGITSKLGPDLSLALGSYEVTPREMAAAYATFAGGGQYQAPILITKITGPHGRELRLPARPAPRPVLTPAEAYITTSLLRSVVEVGTAKQARSLNRPIAGKTGTTNNAKDAWFVGYSTDISCAVWTGFDDAAPLGAREVGSSAALPAFVAFMAKAHQGRPATDFPEPLGLVRMTFDPETGLPAFPGQEGAIEEVFLEGTGPTDMALPDPLGTAPAADEAPADGTAPPTGDWFQQLWPLPAAQ